MTMVEIKSDLATKEFELDELVNNSVPYSLSICAYGSFWAEDFKTLDELNSYLKEEWKFTEEQIKELYSKREIHK